MDFARRIMEGDLAVVLLFIGAFWAVWVAVVLFFKLTELSDNDWQSEYWDRCRSEQADKKKGEPG